MDGYEAVEKGLKSVTIIEAKEAAKSVVAKMSNFTDGMEMADRSYEMPLISAIASTLDNHAREKGKSQETIDAIRLGAVQALYAVRELIDLDRLSESFRQD